MVVAAWLLMDVLDAAAAQQGATPMLQAWCARLHWLYGVEASKAACTLQQY
jgi:hypothetical protein